jgi:hypothetical protein
VGEGEDIVEQCTFLVQYDFGVEYGELHPPFLIQ